MSFHVDDSKTIHFISGLPRAGSTLLANVLAQNPRFHATASSGLLDVLIGLRNNWDKQITMRAAPDEEAKVRVMRAMIHAFHAGTDKPVVFDKSRGWNAHLEIAEKLLDRKAKVIVPVRDIRDVLASFEKIWRTNAATRQVPHERQHYLQMQTIQGRCKLWLDTGGPVGIAYNRIRDAITRGYADRMFFVDFDEFTREPKRVMSALYAFLGEDPFEHNFEYVEQVTHEDDAVHGFVGLHDIRPIVEPVPSRWETVIGPFAQKYEKLNVWKDPAFMQQYVPLQSTYH